jgi:hypothetical protein
VEHDQAGAQQVGQVAAATGLIRFRPAAREDIPPELRPAREPVRGLAHPLARQQPAAQRLGLRFGRPGRGGISRQQLARP